MTKGTPLWTPYGSLTPAMGLMPHGRLGAANYGDVRTRVNYRNVKTHGGTSSPATGFPFELVVKDGKLTVGWGVVNLSYTTIDSSGNKWLGWQTIEPTFLDDGDLAGNPYGNDPLEVSVSGWTGVWLKIPWAMSGVENTNNPAMTGNFISWNAPGFASPCAIYTDTSNTEYFNSAVKDTTDGNASWIYIGKARGSGDQLVRQWLRSDVWLQSMTFPHTILSQNAENALTTGSDNGLYYDEPDPAGP